MIHLPFQVPVDPDRPEARKLLADELAKQEYQAAKPTWFDKLLGDFFDWINSLQFGGTQGPPALGMLLLLVGILVLLLIAFLIFGLPRLNRRSTVTGSLFGDDDARSAAQMRADAEAAAAKDDYTLAIAEMYRSIARGLAERTVLSTSPGTTARDFAARAAVAFASSADELRSSAIAFDEVRYLGATGTRAQYDVVARLERTLRTAKPAALEQIDAGR
jgi:hypothetical protein